jgi:NADPH-dependent ferric siderophore reductase
MRRPPRRLSPVPDREAQVLPDIKSWPLYVTSVTDLTSQFRQIRLTSAELGDFDHRPGQDMMLLISAAGREVRRRYTIRSFDRESRQLELNISMHGEGPGLRWARAVRAGDKIEAIGPRGKVTLVPGADWHLFAGDETAIAACFSMLEALAREVPALALLQVDESFAEQVAWLDAHAPAKVTWIDGKAARAGGQSLPDTLRGLDLPPGLGHAYLGGEVGLVIAARNVLLERGLARDQISAKAYWNVGSANLDKGEPEQRAS